VPRANRHSCNHNPRTSSQIPRPVHTRLEDFRERMSMPLTAGAGPDMPYSAAPVREIVSDKSKQSESFDRGTVRNVGTWEEVMAEMHRARALEIHRCAPNSPTSFRISQLFRAELFKVSSKGKHAALEYYIVAGRPKIRP
jgi:hypothetical protein